MNHAAKQRPVIPVAFGITGRIIVNIYVSKDMNKESRSASYKKRNTDTKIKTTTSIKTCG